MKNTPSAATLAARKTRTNKLTMSVRKVQAEIASVFVEKGIPKDNSLILRFNEDVSEYFNQYVGQNTQTKYAADLEKLKNVLTEINEMKPKRFKRFSHTLWHRQTAMRQGYFERDLLTAKEYATMRKDMFHRLFKDMEVVPKKNLNRK